MWALPPGIVEGRQAEGFRIDSELKGPAYSMNFYFIVPATALAPTGPVFFCKLLLNGASYDTKIVCIRLVWAGAKKINHFATCWPFKKWLPIMYIWQLVYDVIFDAIIIRVSKSIEILYAFWKQKRLHMRNKSAYFLHAYWIERPHLQICRCGKRIWKTRNVYVKKLCTSAYATLFGHSYATAKIANFAWNILL